MPRVPGRTGGPNLKCQICGEIFQAYIDRQKFCSEKCSRKEKYKRHRLINPERLPFASGTVGAIKELQVSVDLMRKGYHVFRALSAHCPCDLMAFKNEKIFKIEVKTGTKLQSGKVHWDKTGVKSLDIWAVYYGKNELSYFDKNLKPIEMK